MAMLSCPLLSHLVPISNFDYGFTTNVFLQTTFTQTSAQFADSDSPPSFGTSFRTQSLEYVDLTNDTALGIIKVASSQLGHPIVIPPPESNPATDESCTSQLTDQLSSSTSNLSIAALDLPLPPPEFAWEAFYPNGSINPSGAIPGGFGFYLNGTKEFTDRLSNGATEIIMGYRMMLESGWEWVKGGKLPGIFGGIGSKAYGCSGGRQDARDACFDVRLMWRAEGAGELYTYLPLTQNNTDRLLAVPPLSIENSDFGDSVGRGAFTIPVGRWMSVALRMKLNQVGCEDGEMELFIDGDSVMSVSGLTLGTSEEARFMGMHFQTFFGGSQPDWASPKDQRAWFADVTGLILR
ncbi:polysaccharide lyase family 14 protein [Collybiopsis luxurians FD-317 M1]|nr:polysaccharide lyase family 14 protein [Collybiopsis luxurians FD-317 M1]